MKKMILIFISAFSLFTSNSFASQSDSSLMDFDFSDKTIGVSYTSSGDNLVYVYKTNEVDTHTKTELKLMEKTLVKNICSTKDLKSLIEKEGFEIIFIYTGDKKAEVISIQKCQ
jgi:hypothetical protein